MGTCHATQARRRGASCMHAARVHCCKLPTQRAAEACSAVACVPMSRCAAEPGRQAQWVGEWGGVVHACMHVAGCGTCVPLPGCAASMRACVRPPTLGAVHPCTHARSIYARTRDGSQMVALASSGSRRELLAPGQALAAYGPVGSSTSAAWLVTNKVRQGVGSSVPCIHVLCSQGGSTS